LDTAICAPYIFVASRQARARPDKLITEAKSPIGKCRIGGKARAGTSRFGWTECILAPKLIALTTSLAHVIPSAPRERAGTAREGRSMKSDGLDCGDQDCGWSAASAHKEASSISLK
jgi:hypothetical protein